MQESYYLYEKTMILNYSKRYINNPTELVNANEFKEILKKMILNVKQTQNNIYSKMRKFYATDDELTDGLIYLNKLLLSLDLSEIHHPVLEDKENFLLFVEESYNFWRRFQRYAVLFTSNEEGYKQQNFLEADMRFNQVVLDFYRTIEEKVQGSQNRVYRQLQAGTNAAALVQYYDWKVPTGYEELKDIPFFSRVMLRTPLILHSKSNTRKGIFDDLGYHPMKDFEKGRDEWFCFPAKIGSQLVFAYFHRNYISSALGMANLFEMANYEECIARKPDAIMLFGNQDEKQDKSFYYDEVENIWVGKLSDCPSDIDYFGYTKKMLLTLHNLANMKKGWLPIHGAMVNIYLKDGTKKGIVLMGDSGAGKSETLEALNMIASEMIDHQEIVFDDMGSLHLDEQGHIKAQGTEIGAFVRLDDLDKSTAYRDMDRSIFFNPEKLNSRLVIPSAPYHVVTNNHDVDILLYANNYTDQRGMHLFLSQEEAKRVFVEGKRKALGTTSEKGISTTFFSNPFGPVQKQEECTVLIDRMFEAIYREGIPVGEIYTCLGLADKGNNGILDAAKALVDFSLIQNHSISMKEHI